MSLASANLFIAGMLAMGYAVATLYFFKFWRQTGDRLFAFFTAAFGLLLIQRVALSAATAQDSTWFYALRLLAFLLIAFAIIDKNRSARS